MRRKQILPLLEKINESDIKHNDMAISCVSGIPSLKDDNKSKEIKLTNEVYLRANELVRKLRELDLELLKDVNKEDLEVFMRVLKNIQDNLKEERK